MSMLTHAAVQHYRYVDMRVEEYKTYCANIPSCSLRHASTYQLVLFQKQVAQYWHLLFMELEQSLPIWHQQVCLMSEQS